MAKKYCYRCGAPYTEKQCSICETDLYTLEPNRRTIEYEEILSLVKDESIAREIIQTHILTDVEYSDILKSMGFKN
jgi:RNA polymerase subunit RPABC4/transcription elongation factor Spt4